MRSSLKTIIATALMSVAVLPAVAQQEITIEDLYVKRTFAANGAPQPTWMEDGDSYSKNNQIGLVR